MDFAIVFIASLIVLAGIFLTSNYSGPYQKIADYTRILLWIVFIVLIVVAGQGSDADNYGDKFR